MNPGTISRAIETIARTGPSTGRKRTKLSHSRAINDEDEDDNEPDPEQTRGSRSSGGDGFGGGFPASTTTTKHRPSLSVNKMMLPRQ
ncbi:hypothetical protein Ct61P_14537 [Colletotrichum tofieldiae]|nr:hypothetical protein Ct61P_14537 [Colletotrichum tofieldiae]